MPIEKPDKMPNYGPFKMGGAIWDSWHWPNDSSNSSFWKKANYNDRQIASGKVRRGHAIVYDRATPRLTAVEQNANRLLRPYLLAAGNAIKQGVIKSYKEANVSSLPNTPATSIVKGNSTQLKETGRLERALHQARVIVDMQDYASMSATYHLTLPVAGHRTHHPSMDRADKGFPYMWSHENGTRSSPHMLRFGYIPGNWKVPARPFLGRGVKAGFVKARSIMNTGLNVLVRSCEGVSVLGSNMPTLNMKRELNWTPYDIAMTLMPPSSLYAVIGQARDFTSVLSGGFSMLNVEQWLMSYGKGQFGLTKKVQRRKMRRRIWA